MDEVGQKVESSESGEKKKKQETRNFTIFFSNHDFSVFASDNISWIMSSYQRWGFAFCFVSLYAGIKFKIGD